jgi:hypothetical protein
VYIAFQETIVRQISRVKMKRLAGRERFARQTKDPVFALLATWVCLTLFLRNPEENELSNVAVSRHLRPISCMAEL